MCEFNSNRSEACMPPSPADVLVGRIASIEKGGELQRDKPIACWFYLKIYRLSLGVSHLEAMVDIAVCSAL
jgi:hypothetical protein